jgi:hypothetical protein
MTTPIHKTVQGCGFQQLNHPSYNLDLTPSSNFLKKFLQRRLSSDDKINMLFLIGVKLKKLTFILRKSSP